YLAAVGDLKKLEDELSAQRTDTVRSDIGMAKTLLIVLADVSLVLGIGGALVITRSVTRPLNEAVDTARVIAGNDLSHTVTATRRDELGDLLRTLGQMQTALRGMV